MTDERLTDNARSPEALEAGRQALHGVVDLVAKTINPADPDQRNQLVHTLQDELEPLGVTVTDTKNHDAGDGRRGALTDRSRDEVLHDRTLPAADRIRKLQPLLRDKLAKFVKD